MPGPVALVGSGEYTAAMVEVDKLLLDGRPRRFVQIPTAAAPEGEARLDYWVRLGREHAARIDAEPVPLLVRTREDADDPDLVAQLDDAGLVYFSGGDPIFLTETIRDTALWRMIVDRWQAGTALGGCSAGAMAFGGWVPSIRSPTRDGVPGLGIVPQITVLPHFDRIMSWMPSLLTRPVLPSVDGIRVVGIDENTALVGGPDEFVVYGRSSAWLFDGDQRHRDPIPAGSAVILSRQHHPD
jgi:cyanophycinase